MARSKGRKPRPPLSRAMLDELALTYVGRFATTRSKLAFYLKRKLRERGWADESPPEIERIVERLAGLGYVDDAAFALSKSRALTGRGYGSRRVRESLRAAGVADEDCAEANDHADGEAVESALRFARRRRIGPFGDGSGDANPAERQRAIAAMVRAGHSYALAREILALEPGSEPDIESLAKSA